MFLLGFDYRKNTDDGQIICFNLAGVKKQDVSVEIIEQDKIFVTFQLDSKQYKTSAFFDDSILDAANAKASFEDGRLSVFIPYKKENRIKLSIT